MDRRAFLAAATGVTAAVSGCSTGTTEGNDSGSTAEQPTLGATLTFDIPAVDSNAIRPRYTCDGENVSPELIVIETGDAIETLALVMDDPDAGPEPYVHWTLWDVPPTLESIPQDVRKQATVSLTEVESEGEPPTVSQGTNDAGSVGYTGPCPPEGEEHLYRFQLYGLSEPLGVEPGADPEAVRDALDGTVVGETTFTGRYGTPTE
ncbi:YbhB/YbcL family Raf kinase inhibitor-like protein [Halomarina oriensis]|uniref:YbhB/YbcL family Raf kinase inhibitor-like protein n=1 Tax=Halomarina oriensis TaxID=671145 RepID=A0A6B0GI01_9EURY|nr:YbhB/YbcL family Raf kinase inhibitor-like protein [Halomarina oriensis]MWG34496.1 YbhB/YbcL family Raf kinase inhibitor-like protein [Halomarina oriensis]